MARIDGRHNNQPRNAIITPDYLRFPEGSALIQMGHTQVICTVTVEDRVPGFLKGTGKGWITAEYNMLPRSTLSRTPRGETSGRASEIQRLIGRSLRAVTDMKALGERTYLIDCDVLQADGGTRTAAITGSYVALYQAFETLRQRNLLKTIPFKSSVAAISAGIVRDEFLLDLCYEEDYQAAVDFNVVMTDQAQLVEVQATAEEDPFSTDAMHSLLALTTEGIKYLRQIQQEAIHKLNINPSSQ